jgi:hypothetical protein
MHVLLSITGDTMSSVSLCLDLQKKRQQCECRRAGTIGPQFSTVPPYQRRSFGFVANQTFRYHSLPRNMATQALERRCILASRLQWSSRSMENDNVDEPSCYAAQAAFESLSTKEVTLRKKQSTLFAGRLDSSVLCNINRAHRRFSWHSRLAF